MPSVFNDGMSSAPNSPKLPLRFTLNMVRRGDRIMTEVAAARLHSPRTPLTPRRASSPRPLFPVKSVGDDDDVLLAPSVSSVITLERASSERVLGTPRSAMNAESSPRRRSNSQNQAEASPRRRASNPVNGGEMLCPFDVWICLLLDPFAVNQRFTSYYVPAGTMSFTDRQRLMLAQPSSHDRLPNSTRDDEHVFNEEIQEHRRTACLMLENPRRTLSSSRASVAPADMGKFARYRQPDDFTAVETEQCRRIFVVPPTIS
jgi:hypothetical protein